MVSFVINAAFWYHVVNQRIMRFMGERGNKTEKPRKMSAWLLIKKTVKPIA